MINQTETVKLHRVLNTTPEKIYQAFLDHQAISKWLPPYGFTCAVHHFEAKVDGADLELKSSEFIKYTDKFDDPNLPGEMLVTE